MENLTQKTNKALKIVLKGLINNNIFNYEIEAIEKGVRVTFNSFDEITLRDFGYECVCVYFNTSKSDYYETCASSQKSMDKDIKEYC